MAAKPMKRNGKWEVAICVDGKRKSARRSTKAECVEWAKETERNLKAGADITALDKTFAELLGEYSRIVSPKKRTGAREQKRIDLICRQSFCDVKLAELKPVHFSQWRDKRLGEVSAGTVLREWNIIRHAINVAITEWGWMTENPINKIQRPKQPLARERRIPQREIEQLLFTMGYERGAPVTTITSRVGAAFLFALTTAMRSKEIVELTWQHVDLDRRVAHVPISKNGLPRDVPLSNEAIQILNQVKSESELVFNVTASQRDALFRKARNKTLVENLHFHDSRAEAITRLAKKFDVLTLARISGHKDIKQLMTYYRESMEDIAARMG